MNFFKQVVHYSLIVVILSFSGCKNKNKLELDSETVQTIQREIDVANNFLSKGENTKAISILEGLQNKYPKNTKLLEAIAFAYSDSGDPGLAALYFERIAHLDPNLVQYRIFAAQSYAETKDWKEVCRNYELYLNSFPNDQAIWNSYAKALESDKQIEMSLKAYEKAQNLSPKKPSHEDLLKIAELYEKTNNLDFAKSYYYKALEENPRSQVALTALLKIEINFHNYPLAEKYLFTLESLNLNSVDSHFLSAQKEKIEQWKKKNAEEFAKKAEELNAKDTMFNPLEEVIAEISNDETSTALSQNNETQLSLFSEKIKSILKTENPHDLFSFQEHSPIVEIQDFRYNGDSQESQELANDLLHSALRAREEGNLDFAIEEHWKALMKNPNSKDCWYELTKTYMKKGDFKNAEMTVLEALRQEPESLPMTLTYLVVLQNNSPEKLIGELQKAKENFPKSPEITYALAKAYDRVENNKHNAKKLYEQFLQEAPATHPMRKQVEQLISAL